MPRIARLLSLLFTALILSFAAQAQDEIHLKNGDVIEAKVREITPSLIKYQKVDDGPLYSLNRRDVRKIVYENGATEEMAERRGTDRDSPRGRFAPGPNAKKFGKNTVALLPIALTDRGPVGFGLRYERTLDKDGYLSAVLPFTLTLVSREQYNSNSGRYENGSRTPFYQFYPGVRFYPATSKHAFAYALGFNLMAGVGREWTETYVNNGTQSFVRYQEANNFRLGMLLSNSLNFAPTPRLHVGLEFMLGFRYLNQYSDGVINNFNNSVDAPSVNFNLGVGYRF